jgi:phage gp45-like
MSDDLGARVAMLERMVATLARRQGSGFEFSRSTAAPVDSGPVQTIQGQLDALSRRDGMPVLFHYGFSSAMPIGGDKAVAYLNANRSSGVVIATGHQTYRVTGLVTGETVIHDMWGRSVKLGALGPVIDANGSPIQILNCTTLTADAELLKVKGDIVDNYPTNTKTVANIRSIYDSHTHGGVSGGGAHTAIPDQII